VSARHLASVEVRWDLPCQRSIASDGDAWTGESERRQAPLRSDDGVCHIVWQGLRTSVYLICLHGVSSHTRLRSIIDILRATRF
jgi:hypothetical protein